MSAANIVFLIDIQKGFEKYDIPQAQGGCLYVPGGEKVGEPATNLIRNLSDAVIVLSQDFHPDDHISFMENHPGVIASRKERLRTQGHAEDSLDEAVLDVLKMPFDNILLKKDDMGHFHAVAFQADGEWRAVKTNAEGYITEILSTPAAPELVEGALQQTLWRKHCVQNTESALFIDPVMNELPERMQQELRKPVSSAYPDACLLEKGGRGNTFYVIRKGMESDMDSYGIATENDRMSTTAAPPVFALIAENLLSAGVKKVDIYIGGLATNFCVEFSHKDVYEYLLPELKVRGIDAKAHFLTDISAGIPISVPDGKWPDLDTATKRMAELGTVETTTDDVIRANLAGRASQPGQPQLQQ